MIQTMSRRGFLQSVIRQAAAAGISTSALAGKAIAQEPRTPNDRITMGFIGLGGMGTGQLHTFVRHPGVRILAVCDVYEKNRMSAKYTVDDEYDNDDCKAYNDFRELLDRDDIDAVLVATPDHWHTAIATAACQAGKDIYCQKPLTLTIDEGKYLVQTVRRYGRVLQVGSQQRSEWNFRFACELVRSGKIGKLHTVTAFLPNGPVGDWMPDEPPPEGLDWDMYLGPRPKVPYNTRRFMWDFRWFFDYSGGQMTDWGAHHVDIAQWGMGTERTGPVEIEGTGERPPDGLFETYMNFNVTCTYANGVRLIITNPERGTRFEGTDGWVQVWRGGIDAHPQSLLNETLGPDDVHLYVSPGHEQDWLNCIRTRQRPICDVEIGYRSVSIPHLANIALRLGRKIEWDPDREMIVGDEEASRWLARPYRSPWML